MTFQVTALLIKNNVPDHWARAFNQEPRSEVEVEFVITCDPAITPAIAATILESLYPWCKSTRQDITKVAINPI